MNKDFNARRYTVAITVLVALGLMAVVAATFRADRNRENARTMRNAVAKLGFAELLERQRACELKLAKAPRPKSSGASLDPVYCQEVTRIIAAQPLQLVDNPPPAHVLVVPSEWEHDRRAIASPGKATQTEPPAPQR